MLRNAFVLIQSAALAVALMLVSVGDAVAQGRDYDRIYFRNKCNRQIQTAIHYKALSGTWVTEGWFLLDPGERAYVANTRNTIYYSYAESIDPVSRRLHWSGDDVFDYIRGSSYDYGFKKQEYRLGEWGSWTESFTCN